MPNGERSARSRLIADAILISSDEEDAGEVSFLGSSKVISTVKIKRPSDAIVIASDTDSGPEDGELDGILNGIDVASSSKLPLPSAPMAHSFHGIESDDSGEEVPLATEDIVKETSWPNKKQKLSETLVESAGLTKEEKQARKDQEKREKDLAKVAAKAAKEAEKSFNKKVSEVNRLRTSKNETVREIHLYMSADMALPASPIAGALPEIKARFTENLSEVHFMADDDSPMPGVIRIKRHVKAKWDTIGKRFIPLDQPFWEWDRTILFIVDAEEIVDKIIHGQNMLVNWIKDTRLLLDLEPAIQIVIVVKGLGKYQAKTKTLANREFTAMARAGLESGTTAAAAAVRARPEKDVIERELIELQVQEGVFIVHVEKTEEMEDWVWNLCADVALRPYKLLSKSHLSFAPVEAKRKASSTTDALELMLQEVQGITQSAAAGIAAEYPTFAELMRAFEKAERKGAAEVLLADCEVRNLRNGTANGRKLNKALAKRVYQVFRGEDSLALA